MRRTNFLDIRYASNDPSTDFPHSYIHLNISLPFKYKNIFLQFYFIVFMFLVVIISHFILFLLYNVTSVSSICVKASCFLLSALHINIWFISLVIIFHWVFIFATAEQHDLPRKASSSYAYLLIL